MKLLTVKQVAKASGVTVRALHHYDTIGLLKPAHRGTNGYRLYGRDELLRLQQILLHRELDIPLVEIASILDSPDFDRVVTLSQQRERLAAEARRFTELVKTIDRTIAHLTGDRAMRHEELYKGFSAEKQAEYERWLVDKYGGDMPERIEASRRKQEGLAEADKAALQSELEELERDLADGMRAGVPAGSERLDALLVRHRDWVAAMWNKPCPPAAYAGLADLYMSHPDFVSRFETIESGFAEYLATSMRAFAGRQST